MTEREKKFLGILGGMGSQAGLYLFQKVLSHTPVKVDQDHLEILVYSNARVPDRTEGILGQGPSAEPELIRSVVFLEQAGVDCIIIACVTAHHYLKAMRARVDTRILSLVEETCSHLEENLPGRNRVGLLASTATLKARVFQEVLETRSLKTVLLPDALQEDLVMGAIYGPEGIKVGFTDEKNREKLRLAADALIQEGAEIVLAACTEIPLVLKETGRDVPLLDPMDILAARAVKVCLGDGG